MKKVFFLSIALLAGWTATAQMKVYSNGKIAFGSTTTTPSYIIDVITGDINVNTLSNGYKINGNYVLQQKNISSCIFVGVNAGISNTGANNTAVGYTTLYSNVGGTLNSAFGAAALNANTTGSHNSAFGYTALNLNQTGAFNSAFGDGALNAATTSYNTAIGYESLVSLSTGDKSTAVGAFALSSVTTGTQNVAIGYEALQTTTAGGNAGLGYAAGYSNTTGHHNTFVGYIAVGGAASYTNCAAIGNGASAPANDKYYFGNSTVLGCYNTAGNWTSSDARFKTNVKEDVKGLDFIKKLRPVTYNLNTQALDDFFIQNQPDSMKTLHKDGMDFTKSMAITHAGFLAQEVEQTAQQVGFNSSIVSPPSNSSDLYALNYAEIVVPLVKAIQELSKTADSLTNLTNKQDSINKALQTQLNNLSNKTGQRTIDNKQDSINNALLNLINACCSKAQVNSSQSNSVSGSNTVTSANSSSAILYQNNPNPFTQTTVVKCFIPQNSQNTTLLVFDLNGSMKKSFSINETGTVNITINGNQLVSGMYYYTLLINGQEIDTKKMILTEN